jgi:hypothetical protein
MIAKDHMPLVKVLVLPVTRRHWLFTAHAHGLEAPKQAGSQTFHASGALGWLQSVPARAFVSVQQRWEDLRASPEGTWKHWFYTYASSQ